MIVKILIYGFSLAILTWILKYFEFRYLAHDLTMDFYIGIIALGFTAIGVWSGLKINKRVSPSSSSLIHNNSNADFRELGISNREFEVLELMAGGMSNQEIADKLFVSVNTVKTHSASLYRKLDANRRTQAIKKAKELNIIA